MTNERTEADRLLGAAWAHFLVGDPFIQKLEPTSNVAAVARIMYLNDIREWCDEYKAYRKTQESQS